TGIVSYKRCIPIAGGVIVTRIIANVPLVVSAGIISIARVGADRASVAKTSRVQPSCWGTRGRLRRALRQQYDPQHAHGRHERTMKVSHGLSSLCARIPGTLHTGAAKCQGKKECSARAACTSEWRLAKGDRGEGC